MMAAHTPGPWQVKRQAGAIAGAEIITEDERTWVASVYANDEEMQGNARLIAQAPTMLFDMRTILADIDAFQQKHAGTSPAHCASPALDLLEQVARLAAINVKEAERS